MPIYFASVRSRRQGKHCATKITSKTTVPMTPELQAAEEMADLLRRVPDDAA
jgi:hypothetical protein